MTTSLILYLCTIMNAILPTTYFGPVQYYSKLKSFGTCLIEHYEHFRKQTYRSRCDIYSPNGLLTLSVPLVKRNQRQAVKDVRIAYDTDWQTLHWRSLESSYRRSPFFEFYEDDLRLLFSDKKPEFLIDLNEAAQQLVLSLLKMKPTYSFTAEYLEEYPSARDFREIISPKSDLNADPEFKPQPYWQVFEPRHGFIPNLSILDLLFNQGPRGTDYL
jgi:hypothetical protein